MFEKLNLNQNNVFQMACFWFYLGWKIVSEGKVFLLLQQNYPKSQTVDHINSFFIYWKMICSTFSCKSDMTLIECKVKKLRRWKQKGMNFFVQFYEFFPSFWTSFYQPSILKLPMRFNNVVCVLGNAADSHTFHFTPCLQTSRRESVCVSQTSFLR